MIKKGKVSFYSNQITFNYNQRCHPLHLGSTQYKQFPQKKKKPQERKRKGKRDENKEKKNREVEKKRRRTERWKKGEEEKMDGKSLCERKGKRENEMWKKRRKERRENEREGEGEGEEMRGRERRIENRESGTRNVPPSPDASPSTKLGNNITPIKGRLGKNTTPTSRGPTKLNQNPQADPQRRRSSLDASFHVDLSYTPRRVESPKYGFHSNGAAIYKKAKALGNSRNRFNSP